MADKKQKPATSVQAFLDALEHPLKREIFELRELILGVDPAISEEVKWNAPSFRTGEHFATMHLRASDSLQLILHLGAKSKRAIPEESVADPKQILKWLGPGRATVMLAGTGSIARVRAPLAAIIRQWVKLV
jgi:hypothetical protein